MPKTHLSFEPTPETDAACLIECWKRWDREIGHTANPSVHRMAHGQEKESGI